jgi:hypothetical protein
MYHESVAKTSSSRRGSAVKNALDDILHRLATLPVTPDASALQAQAEDFQRQVGRWSSSLPTATEKEHFMRKVLRLHGEVAALERHAHGA